MTSQNDDDNPKRPRARSGRGRSEGSKKTQFTHGHRGTGGRPARKKATASWAHELTDEMVLREASRMISVGENGETLSVREVVFRSMVAKASKQDPRALKLVNDTINNALDRSNATKAKAFGDMAMLKDSNQAILDKAKRAGRAPPDVFPHPDNIVISYPNAGFFLFGGWTLEENQARIFCRMLKEVYEEEIAECELALAENPEDQAAQKVIVKSRYFAAKLAEVESLPPIYFGVTPEDEVAFPSAPPNVGTLTEAQVMKFHTDLEQRGLLAHQQPQNI